MVKLDNVASAIADGKRVALHFSEGPTMGSNSSIPEPVALLFRIYTTNIGNDPYDRSYLNRITAFVESFNRNHVGPYLFDPADLFTVWPENELEEWYGEVHKRFYISALITHKSQSFSSTTMAFDIYGVINMPVDHYRQQYLEIATVQKLSL